MHLRLNTFKDQKLAPPGIVYFLSQAFIRSGIYISKNQVDSDLLDINLCKYFYVHAIWIQIIIKTKFLH